MRYSEKILIIEYKRTLKHIDKKNAKIMKMTNWLMVNLDAGLSNTQTGFQIDPFIDFLFDGIPVVTDY